MSGIDPMPHAVAAAALAVLWGHAGLTKLRDAARFEGVLADYRLLPAAMVAPLARVLPWLELALAAALVSTATRPAAAIASAAMLLAYAAAVAVNLGRGRRSIDCGCGGEPQPIHPWIVGRNGVLAAVSVALLAPLGPRELGALDGLNAATALAALVGLHATIEQWLRNRQAMRGGAGIGRG